MAAAPAEATAAALGAAQAAAVALAQGAADRRQEKALARGVAAQAAAVALAQGAAARRQEEALAREEALAADRRREKALAAARRQEEALAPLFASVLVAPLLITPDAPRSDGTSLTLAAPLPLFTPAAVSSRHPPPRGCSLTIFLALDDVLSSYLSRVSAATLCPLVVTAANALCGQHLESFGVPSQQPHTKGRGAQMRTHRAGCSASGDGLRAARG